MCLKASAGVVHGWEVVGLKTAEMKSNGSGKLPPQVPCVATGGSKNRKDQER